MVQTISLQDIQEMWSLDSKVNPSDFDTELLRIPTLHAKYLGFLSNNNLKVKKITVDFAKLKKIKWRYYSGKLSQEELKEFGWTPFPYTLKSEIELYLEGDQDLGDLFSKKAYHEEIVSYCTAILKELNNRTWQLRSAIDYIKFTSGR